MVAGTLGLAERTARGFQSKIRVDRDTAFRYIFRHDVP
jgi:hypothetical protein